MTKSYRSSHIALIVAFLLGMCFNQLLNTHNYVASTLTPTASTETTETVASSSPSLSSTSAAAESFSTVPAGVYPLLQDFQCGHENMQPPRALGLAGNGRIVVDVGLDQGLETLDAVEHGFVVFGFEMMTGSVERIQVNAKIRKLGDRVHVVKFQANQTDGSLTIAKLPDPPKDGKGFAYIFNAGLSDQVGAMASDAKQSAGASLVGHETNQTWSPGMVPIMKLEDAIPDWVDKIFMLKVDTQGYDLKVLKGAESYLSSNKIKYALYEFSPKLMREGDLGDPLDLLRFLTDMGAVCFDMMGTHHNKFTRPSTSLEKYLDSLESGRNSLFKGGNYKYHKDQFGPWDDVMCWFPLATS